MESTTIAVDLAKHVFQVAVSHTPGHVALERRLPRARLRAFFAQQPPATVVMEACGSAHYWARELQPLGHTIRLLPPHDVHRYVRRNKTDRTDTRAMLEAHRNADIHPVPVKSVEQQTVTALHRLRATWLATRTARINTLRGILREFGVIIPVGAHHVGPALRTIGEAADVPRALHALVTAGADEIAALETAVGDVDRRLAALARQLPDAALLQTIPGIGVITATAFIGQVGCPQRFPSGRHFASYLGLTAREASSAQHRRLGAISKQGDTYLRMLLTHGARSILCHAKRQAVPDALRAWALRAEQRRGHNVAAVALANKLARIVWAVWTRHTPYTAPPSLPR